MFCLLFFGFNLLAGCLGWIDFDARWDVVRWCFILFFLILLFFFFIFFYFQLCGFFFIFEIAFGDFDANLVGVW